MRSLLSASTRLADLLIGLIPSESIPWNEVDLTVPGHPERRSDRRVDVPLPRGPVAHVGGRSLTLDLELPPGFAYVPGGATLDGVAGRRPDTVLPGRARASTRRAATRYRSP